MDEETIKEDIKTEDKQEVKRKGRKWRRRIFRILLLTVIVVLLLPGLLYIPGIQRYVVRVASEKVSEATGYDVRIGYFSLGFPLDLVLDDVLVLNEQRDTLVAGREIRAGIGLLPLLRGGVGIKSVALNDAYYRMVSADSSMVMTARVGQFSLDASRAGLIDSRLDLSEARLSDSRIDLWMDPLKAEPTPPDTTKSEGGWLINLDRLSLRNVEYRMKMMPAIDSMRVLLGEGDIDRVSVNLASSLVSAGSLHVGRLDASYYLPDSVSLAAFNAAYKPDTIPTPPSEPWTIVADSLRVTDSRALYAVRSLQPAEGMDFNYLQLDSIDIAIGRFFNRGGYIKVPIRRIAAVERSGIALRSLSGEFEMTEDGMGIKHLELATDDSWLRADGGVESALFAGDDAAGMSLKAQAGVGIADVERVMPMLKPLLRSISKEELRADIDVAGTAARLDVSQLSAKINNLAELSATGEVVSVMDAEKIGGSLDLKGKLSGNNRLRSILGLGSDIFLPYISLRGKASYGQSAAQAQLTALTSAGKVVGGGRIHLTREQYKARLSLRELDVHEILPSGPVGVVDADIEAEGRGYNPYRMKAQVNGAVHLVEYDSVACRDITVDAFIDKGAYEAHLLSANPSADFDLMASGTIAADEYTTELTGQINNIDLMALNLSTSRLGGGMTLNAKARANIAEEQYSALVRMSDMFVLLPGNTFRTDSIDLGFYSDTARTYARLRNNDLLLTAFSPMGVMSLTDSLGVMATALDTMLLAQRVNVRALNSVLPELRLAVKSGNQNIVSKYLQGSGIGYNSFNLLLDKQQELTFGGRFNGLASGGLVFDTLTLDGKSQEDAFVYDLAVSNRKGNREFVKTASLNGMFAENRMQAFLTQTDKNDQVGFSLGMNVEVADSIVTLNLYPENPVIAFRQWNINPGNYLSLDLATMKLKADLMVKSDEWSYINIYTDRDGQFHNGGKVEFMGIALADWLTMSPFAPPIAGDLSGRMDLNFNDKYVWGDGQINVIGMKYGKEKVGNIGLKTLVAMDSERKRVYLNGDLSLNQTKFLTVKGYRSDSLPEPVYNIRVGLDRLPMSAVDAFVPDEVGRLYGTLNGEMTVTGVVGNPDIRGYLQFDSARVDMPKFGTALRFDNQRIPIEDGMIKFDEYDLYSANENPVTINGTFRFLPFDAMYSNLKIGGKNVQVVNGKKNGKSELYGRGFVDIGAMVTGPMDKLDVKASLSLLSGTSLTYVYQSTAMSITETTASDMIKFVNLSDTTALLTDSLKSKPFGMRVKAALSVQPNAVFVVNLSPDGKNSVKLDGEGILSYSQTLQGDMNLIGTYKINSGYVRYSPPMMSEIDFKFQEGSNIAWTGDVLNPAINITAVQTRKVNVGGGQQGSRSVPFDITLKVGNRLNALDVSFDLSTDADMTIANELSSMTPEQRSSQAMNMMLTGSYLGNSGLSSLSSSAGGVSGDMAFSFLESVFNRWAANNIKGIDFSIGIDQYDKATKDGGTSTTTSYSYKVSKSLFDDRFKVVVGGNYSTDASAEDNLSQNLLNDVSFEYMLNKSGTTYIKLFHHQEYESILEGEITETGCGFVWKRKINSLRDIFRFVKPKETDPKTEIPQ